MKDQKHLHTEINTRYWNLTDFAIMPLHRVDDQIQEVASFLQAGNMIAFPTETVYGLGANARNDHAVQRIFDAKGRPSDNPLIVHIAHRWQLDEFVSEVNDTAVALMDVFWPGPLTLVLPLRGNTLSKHATAGLSTVAVRMPSHPIALALLNQANAPIAAPSANRSGRPSPTSAAHVKTDLEGKISGIVDGGPTGIGVESTVVRVLDSGNISILRPGSVTAEQLQQVVSSVVTDPMSIKQDNKNLNDSFVPHSPGMKYAHYAPKGKLCIVTGSEEAVISCIRTSLRQAKTREERTAVLAFQQHIGYYDADFVYSLGDVRALEQAAKVLYAVLRRCDTEGVTYIMAESCPMIGVGEAIMNRLLKAANYEIVHA